MITEEGAAHQALSSHLARDVKSAVAWYGVRNAGGASKMAKGTVVGVAGGSGSGKTTLCGQLIDILGDAAVLVSCDRYYHCQSHLSPAARERVNYDHPDAIDYALLATHLDTLRNGGGIAAPEYCFRSHTRTGSTWMAPRPVVIVEGSLLFVRHAICEALDFKIFVDAEPQTRLARRLARDCVERGRTERSVRQQWSATVSVMHQEFIAPTQSQADMSIRTDLETPVDVAEIAVTLRSLATNARA